MLNAQKLLIDNRTLELMCTYMPSDDALEAMGDFFSVLSDGTRLKLLSALSISEMCVTDLSLSLKINQTTVSHQLRALKNIGAVKVRRQGRISFYSIKNNSLLDIMLKAVEFVS